MAIGGRLPVDSVDVFPHGLYAFVATEVEPARDFERSTSDRFVQQVDKDTGLAVWTFEVLDADPQARDKAITVRIVAEHKPVLPEAPAGMPFRPVEFEGLTVAPSVDTSRCSGGPGAHRCRARLAWSFRATGIVAPKPRSAGRSRESKDAAA